MQINIQRYKITQREKIYNIHTLEIEEIQLLGKLIRIVESNLPLRHALIHAKYLNYARRKNNEENTFYWVEKI